MDNDIGLVLVRLALGPMLILHGLNKVWGGGGLAGTTNWFQALGLRPARWHARLAAGTEVVAGVMLTIGLLTTGAAAAYVGLMTVAIWTDHRGKGFFVFKGGYEYALVVALVSLALAALGAGAWSLDAVIGVDLAGVGWMFTAAVTGVASAVGLLAVCYRPVRAAEPASNQPSTLIGSSERLH